MRRFRGLIIGLVAFLICCATILVAEENTTVELSRHLDQFSSAKLQPARMNETPGIAVIFTGTDNIHYYADKNTAPGGFGLTVEPKASGISFADPVFPTPRTFFDKGLNKNIKVYVGNFTVFVPIISADSNTTANVTVRISAITCTSQICLTLEKTLITSIDYSKTNLWGQIEALKTQAGPNVIQNRSYSVIAAFALALIAGLSLNIMPCVWPVLPIIIMRILQQSKEKKSNAILMGLAFCAGILLFFASLACANIIMKVFFDTVLQLGDQLRNSGFVTAMAMLLIMMALFMFGLFNIVLPSSVTSKTSEKKGLAGSVGMGFLAALLSTPCSFGILAAAFGWAQTQNILLGSSAIIIIGIGMAIPYAILTSMPNLLKKLPKAGRWMELFKQAIGFVLLAIALKLISALPQKILMPTLLFAIILAFGTWVWGNWVTYSTKPAKKWIIRVIAVIMTLLAGLSLLSPQKKLIDWQQYDAELISKSIEQGRPVLIKFTADWCTNCIPVEKLVYSRKDIAELIKAKGVLPILADTTTKDASATYALKDIYKEPGVPVTVLYLPSQKEPIRLRSLSFAKELKKLLNRIPE